MGSFTLFSVVLTVSFFILPNPLIVKLTYCEKLFGTWWDFFPPYLCRYKFSLMGYFPGKSISEVRMLNSFFRWAVLALMCRIRNLAIFPSFLKLVKTLTLQDLLYLTSCWISCLPWSKMLEKCLSSKLLSKNHLY